MTERTVKPYRRLGGLYKRCRCGRKAWTKCAHPWTFDFHRKTCTCPTSRRCPHWSKNRVRVSLHKVADKPLSYAMSKSEAAAWRDKLRADMRVGSFARIGTRDPRPDTRRTVADLAERYLEEHVRRPDRRPQGAKATEYHLRILTALELKDARGALVPFGRWPLDAVTTDDVERVRTARRAQLRTTKKRTPKGRAGAGHRGGEIGVEHFMAGLRTMFAWAAKRGLVQESPFRRNGQTVVSVKAKVPRGRTRRLHGDEEQRLLTHAGPHLRDLIIAAVETGCRRGELLSLQWRHVSLGEDLLRLDAENTKTAEARSVPITNRLRQVLDARRTGPDGRAHGPNAYVFGNEVGEPIGTVRTAWLATCRRAGVEGLNFHDLRREFASRLLESGAAEHDVRDWLGHANITTTSRYLRSTPVRLQQAKERLERHREAAERDDEPNAA